MPTRTPAIVPLLAAVPALAQWSINPAVNLPIGDKPGEQNQPKIRAVNGGGVYISWLDNAAGGYDTYIQRLSHEGVEQFPHNGVLVADTAFSSTQDYGLAVDASNNAIVAYRDDRAGGTQVGVNKVNFADGSLAWGAAGKVLTSTTDFIASPHVCVTSDGFIVVSWTQGSNAVLQKLDAAGNAVWPAPVVIAPAGGSYTVTDVVQGDEFGGVIVGLVKGPQRHLHAQKITAGGAPGWGATPLVVFDGSALQFGYFPAPKYDAVGGAVFAWYETGGTRNVWVQRINDGGMEAFPHNGTPVSTDTSLIRLSPDFSLDTGNGEIFVFWTDTNQGQSQWGLSGQKISYLGARRWGQQPPPLLPLGPNQNSFVRAATLVNTPLVFYFDRAGDAQIRGMRIQSLTGETEWSTTVCSVPSGKARLDVASDGGLVCLAWGDSRHDTNDAYAQSVNGYDGGLGLCYANCNFDGMLNLADFGCFQTKFALGDPYADCNNDGVRNLADFGCFQTKFALGCP